MHMGLSDVLFILLYIFIIFYSFYNFSHFFSLTWIYQISFAIFLKNNTHINICAYKKVNAREIYYYIIAV